MEFLRIRVQVRTEAERTIGIEIGVKQLKQTAKEKGLEVIRVQKKNNDDGNDLITDIELRCA